MRISRILSYFLLAAAAEVAIGCDQRGQSQSRGAASVATTALSDKALEKFQSDLLDLAFDAATAIPIEPHIKDRSKTQQRVIGAWLELEQPRRAAGSIPKIQDWRRGAALAELAQFCVEHGDRSEVSGYLRDAERISETVGLADWRRSDVRVRIAKAYAMLGDDARAGEFEEGIEAHLVGQVEAVRARTGPAGSFDEQMRRLEVLATSQRFEVVRNGMEAYVQLYGRHYRDPQRRAELERRIKSGYARLPIFIQVDLLMSLADFALDHEDSKEGLRLVNETQAVVDGAQWPLDYHIPLIARISALRFRAGDSERARGDLKASLDRFEAHRTSMVNIDRAGVLRPIAEAFAAMDDTGGALSVYKRAVEEGIENPNSRPRAEDLSATCCSMAIYAVEPDPQLWARVRTILAELRDPW